VLNQLQKTGSLKTMNQREIITQLQTVFDTVFTQAVPLSSKLSAHDVEEWDSLSHVSLILAVEHTFGIRFRIGEVEMTRNVGELADLIAMRVAKA
jgi:acyl carrier protein